MPIGLTAHDLVVEFKSHPGGSRHLGVTLLEGPAGWGEFSPVPGYVCDPARCWAAAVASATVPWPLPRRRRVAVNGLIPAVPPAQAEAMAGAWLAANSARSPGSAQGTARGGETLTLKVKVGDYGDVGRVAAVRSALGPHHRLRVDANGAWTLEQATLRLAAMATFDLEMAEQPVMGLEDLARLRRQISIPLAVDEDLRTLADVVEIARREAADVAVIKVQPLGGVHQALEVAAAAAAAGLGLVVSALMETSVGIAAGLALAAAVEDLPYACGLGTASLLVGDVVDDPLSADGGYLKVRRPSPDPILMAGLAVPGPPVDRTGPATLAGRGNEIPGPGAGARDCGPRPRSRSTAGPAEEPGRG
ncbi:MAG: enolase C-terminal domain-like protein [Acidimicrobiales bacterium]